MTEPPKANAEQIRQALRAASERRRPAPEFQRFLNTLDAMQLHITLYLIADLKISPTVVPQLLPLIDPSCFEDRLKFEVDNTQDARGRRGECNRLSVVKAGEGIFPYRRLATRNVDTLGRVHQGSPALPCEAALPALCLLCVFK